jgi:hypothetical protein
MEGSGPAGWRGGLAMQGRHTARRTPQGRHTAALSLAWAADVAWRRVEAGALEMQRKM